MDNCISFDFGIDNDRIYAHRGDIFICEGLFKSIDEINKNDHIIGKPDRPVLIVSNDVYNTNIVKVLPFSSKSGSDTSDSITSYRIVKVPGIRNNSNPSYIDVSQIFTINTYQLKFKLGHACQEIVDTAVALHTLQNIENSNSINTIVKIFKDKYPKAQVFQSIDNGYVNNKSIIMNNMYDPSVDLFSEVQQVSYEQLISENKNTLKDPETKDDAYQLYQEWLNLGTDLFRNKYHITRQQYIVLRDKCVCKMLGKVPNFKKYDWSS